MKLKTLGELLAEDMGTWVEDELGHEVKQWLTIHNITDATPLVVEAVGTVEGEWDGDVKAEAIFYEGNSGNAIDGRTVALLAKPHDGTEGGG